MAKFQVIIGRAEQVDFAGTILSVPAKIDTGAYSSSVHASNITETIVDGKKTLKFTILGHKNSPNAKTLSVASYSKVTVRSSNGHNAERFRVKLKIKIANKIFYTIFTLTDRSNNVYPVLIGRQALNSRFIVDSSKTSVKITPLLQTLGIKLSGFEGEL